MCYLVFSTLWANKAAVTGRIISAAWKYKGWKIDENEMVKNENKNIFSKKLLNVFPRTIDAHPAQVKLTGSMCHHWRTVTYKPSEVDHPPAGTCLHFHRNDTSYKKLPEMSGKKKLNPHKHSLTCRLVSLQTASGNRQPSPFLFQCPCPPVHQDRAHLPYNICDAQESPFSNIFSFLAERGTRGFLSQRDAF